MKNNVNRIKAYIGLAIVFVLLIGCGTKESASDNAKKGADPLKAAQSKFDTKDTDIADRGDDEMKSEVVAGSDLDDKDNEGGMIESGKSDDTDDAGSDDADTKDDEKGDFDTADTEELGVLGFEDQFNSAGYNGFLLCNYDNPYEIDWHEVMYNGADIGTWGLNDKQLKAYLKKIGETELMTDVTSFTKEDFEEFVKLHTGTDPADMKKPLDWVYLPEFDLYVYQHGDTNQRQVEFVSEKVDGNVHTIKYNYDSYNSGTAGGVPNEVKFKVENGNYVFISNKCLDDSFSGYNSNSEFVFPYSSNTRLSESDLRGRSEWELRIARNEIYARHGRKFSDKELQQYFDSCQWYYGTIDPKKWKEDVLSQIEKDNIKLISDYEKKHFGD